MPVAPHAQAHIGHPALGKQPAVAGVYIRIEIDFGMVHGLAQWQGHLHRGQQMPVDGADPAPHCGSRTVGPDDDIRFYPPVSPRTISQTYGTIRLKSCRTGAGHHHGALLPGFIHQGLVEEIPPDDVARSAGRLDRRVRQIGFHPFYRLDHIAAAQADFAQQHGGNELCALHRNADLRAALHNQNLGAPADRRPRGRSTCRSTPYDQDIECEIAH